MKDIISREETINLINEHFDRLEKEIREHCVISDAVMVISKCIKTKNALKKDIRELKSRFPAKENKMRNEKPRKYEDGWIDVNVDLPWNNDYILVSFENCPLPDIGRYKENEIGEGTFYPAYDGESYISKHLYVNAWRPLPKPYKGMMKEAL